MTERERLIDTLGEFPVWHSTLKERWMPEAVEKLADHLLSNGVIVPPVNVNQFVYVIDRADIRQPIKEKIVLEIQCGYSGNWIVLQDTPLRWRLHYHLGDFGKIIFPTREQAEEALKERSEGK